MNIAAAGSNPQWVSVEKPMPKHPISEGKPILLQQGRLWVEVVEIVAAEGVLYKLYLSTNIVLKASAKEKGFSRES